MNFRKRMMAAMLVVMMQCSLCVASAVADEGSKGKQEEGKEVQILFTHDMHSHLDAYKAKKEEQTVRIGGFAKLKTMIDKKRAEHPATFLVDGVRKHTLYCN